jgi:sulfite exporter TauE/SafE
MLTLGLVTSLHCISMCGPMVASYAVKDTTEGTVADRVMPNLAYQGAKIASYVMVGMVLGAIGGALNLDLIRPYVMLGAGVFMIVLGLGMTGYFPWAAKLTPRPPRFLVKAIAATRKKASEDASRGVSSLTTPVTFGLLTGLMPCAPLMAAQLTAASSGSALYGGLAMLAFGIGTAPLMLGFGTASTLIPPKLKQRAMALLAIVVIAFGAVYLNRAALLLGSPFNFENARQMVLGSSEPSEGAGYTIAEDGVAEVQLTIENVQFVPANLNFPADQPVRLIVDRREANACSDQIAIPQLGVLQDLAPNAVTVVEVPAAPAGSYTLTCGMGMMYGQIGVGTAAATSSGASPALLAIVGVVASGGAFYVIRRRRLAGNGGRSADRTGKQPGAASPSGGGVLGLTPAETILAVAAIGTAVVAGLLAGGLLI